MSEIKRLLSAGYPVLSINTQEPERVTKAIVDLASGTWQVLAWDCLRGTLDIAGEVLSDDTNPVSVMSSLSGMRDTILIMHNLHLFLEIPEVMQAIENGTSVWKSRGNCVVILAPSYTAKAEVDKLIHVIDYPLPDLDDMLRLQAELVTGSEFAKLTPDKAIARAARGLTELEAETAFAMCLSERGAWDVGIIQDIKSQMIRKSGFMQNWEAEDLSSVGGLGEYKDWLNRVKPAFTDPNGKPAPRAVLFVGIAGGGKSLSAKATASVLSRPLIRLDVNSAKGSLQGESAKNLRTIIRTIEAFGESVVWIDEVEKMFAGGASTQSAASDAGTSVSMFGVWLTFMQETTAPCLIVATANDVSALPSAFLRRFDEVFFVDLPNQAERAEIIGIMNRRYPGANLPDSMADTLTGYTGAEIEKVARKSLYYGPGEAAKRVTPVSRMASAEIDGVRAWARNNGAQRANSLDVAETTTRKIRLQEV